MQSSKLLKLLRKLPIRELHRFERYVESPFFCTQEKLKVLCRYLIAFAPTFDHPKLDKQLCYAVLFPGQSYKEASFHNLVSDLLHLLYDFLAYRQYEQEGLQRKLYLMQGLFEKDADQHIERTARRVAQLLAQHPHRSYDYYDMASRYHEQLDRFEVLNKKRQFNANLELTDDYLDRFYIINKLRLAVDMASRNAIIKATYESSFLADIVGWIVQKPDLKTEPVIQLYYTALLMLQERSNTRHYHQLRAQLVTHNALLPLEEARNLYNYLLNYTIQKINSGDSGYYKEALGLYQSMLEQEIIFVDGYLTQWSYKNIITTGIRLQAFDWIAEFMVNYQDRLLPTERANAVAYNMAAVHYAKGEYEEALVQLQDVEFTDSSYHLGAKIIQLKSYYTLDETEPFFALIEAFRKYLRRNRQIGDYRKKANMNLLKLAQRSFRLKQEWKRLRPKVRQAKWEQLKERLEGMEPVANKDWLDMVVAQIYLPFP